MTSRRAVVDPLTLTLVALVALAAGVFGTSWKPLEFLKPKPPTEQLTKLQAELDAQKAEAARALAASEAAKREERAKLEAEVRAAQQDNVGTVTALARVPEPHKTAEVKLAAAMAERAALKLGAAIGHLPPDQQAAMVELITQALSSKQAEIDAANAKLAERDAAFAVLARERDAVKAQIPVLEQKAANAAETVKAKESEVVAVTEKVKVFAARADAKEREAGGFKASADRAFSLLLWIAGGWAVLVYVVPGFLKHLSTDNPLKPILRNVVGWVSSPLLYSDAKKKLNAAAQQIQSLTNAPFPPR